MKQNTAEKLKNHPNIGSYEKLGQISGRGRCAAWKWSKNSKGRIPGKAMELIVKWAKRKKIDLGLTVEDFV